MSNLTPMMQQYHVIKQQYADAILFFRLGDFYEMFYDDANLASKELEIALTSREGGQEKVPMCGVPFHAADSYIARLVARGYKVAICEQVEDPKSVKGLVKREVIRVITPGTILDEKVLQDKENNYLAALTEVDDSYGLAFVDISTGEFAVAAAEKSHGSNLIFDEIIRLNPAECLVSEHLDNSLWEKIKKNLPYVRAYGDISKFTDEERREILKNHFQVLSLEEFGFDHLPCAVMAAAMVLHYLQETQKIALEHLTKISIHNLQSYMMIDLQTRRNLELTATIRSQAKLGSLIHVLDLTETAMGGRKLKQWLEQPLLDKQEIDLRLDATEELVHDVFIRQELKMNLKKIYDLERLLGRVAYQTANARDLLALKNSLQALEPIKSLLSKTKSGLLQRMGSELSLFPDLIELLDHAIIPEPPISVKDGGLIRPGFNQQVDQLRNAASEGKTWISNLEQEERERTGIKSLKIRYNKVFGYYIEITNANLNNVPVDYIRKQTLVNAERYITPKLKEYEDLVLHSQERLQALEYEIFQAIRQTVAQNTAGIQKTAQLIAAVDVLHSFAEVAIRNNYTKPLVEESDILEIVEGRHPVVEKIMDKDVFVPNNCYLNTTTNQLAVITGPNMAGKSTYIRTVALLAIMAQIGCYVPASRARIGLVDRVFARVGASDDLATGQSTFMVEMNEVANILNNASKRSLIILDEVGRGTSTLDGLSIAWAISEYILQTIKARTLFATHYHELVELEELFPGARNYSMAVKEFDDKVIFLRTVVPGGTNRSYGIHVAQLAGLPQTVISRAKEKLAEMEEEVIARQHKRESAVTGSQQQLSFLLPHDYQPVIDKIRGVSPDHMTPLEALHFLYEVKRNLK